MLKHCIYQNHIETAVKLNNSSAYITNASFLSNSAGYSYYDNKVGGAMMVTESMITITNNTFRVNSAERGGPVS